MVFTLGALSQDKTLYKIKETNLETNATSEKTVGLPALDTVFYVTGSDWTGKYQELPQANCANVFGEGYCCSTSTLASPMYDTLLYKGVRDITDSSTNTTKKYASFQSNKTGRCITGNRWIATRLLRRATRRCPPLS